MALHESKSNEAITHSPFKRFPTFMSHRTQDKPFSHLLIPLILILMVAIAGVSFRYYNYEHHPKSVDEILLPVSPQPSGLTSSSIGVGLVVANVYNFDAGKKTFDADGWIWITWSADVEKQLKKRSMAPRELFFFYNGVSDYDFSLVPDTTAPLRLENGRYYQKYIYSGHFYVNDLNFRLYPFQTIKLPIAFELKPEVLLNDGTPLSLVLDHEHSGTGSYVEVSGYVSKGFTFTNYRHQYRNSHGEPGLTNDIRSLLQARFEVSYERAPMATVIKLILPLLSVMVILLMSPLIPSTGWDVKLAIPPTVMLTLIFLQQSYQSNLPELPYITFLDCLYNMCYMDCLLLFGLFLWGSMAYHFSSEEDRQETMFRIHKVDRRFLLLLVVLFPIEGVVNWYVVGFPWQ